MTTAFKPSQRTTSDTLIQRATDTRYQLDGLFLSLYRCLGSRRDAEHARREIVRLVTDVYLPQVTTIRERAGAAWIERQREQLENPPKLSRLWDEAADEDGSVSVDEFNRVLVRYTALWDIVNGNVMADTLDRLASILRGVQEPVEYVEQDLFNGRKG